jgi:hypothetical protein
LDKAFFFKELRDISSMAMEHFDDKIVPGLVKKYQNQSAASSSSTSPVPGVMMSTPKLMSTLSSSYYATPSPRPLLSSSQSPFKVVRDEFSQHKKKTAEMLRKHRVLFKKVFLNEIIKPLFLKIMDWFIES